MRRALAAVVVGVALVAGACGDGNGDGSASGDLPLLPSAGGGAPTRSTSEAMASGSGAAGSAPATADATTDMIAPGEPYRPMEYRLGDDVDPLGGKAAAHRVEADIDEAAVAKLAKAFGVTAKPVQNGTAWEAGDSAAGTWLRADANGMFSYANGAETSVAASSGVAVACAPDQTCTAPEPTAPPTTAPPADLPSDADAKARANDLLRDAGVRTDDLIATVDRSDYGVTVIYTIEVDGIPVEGFGHSVAFGDKGVIQYASGVLARPSKIGDYPLVDTKAAFDRWTTERNGGATIMGATRDAAGAAEPAIDPAAPVTSDVPPSTLAPQILTIDRVERSLLVEFGRCPGDPIYLVPAYRLYVGDELHAVVPAVAEKYIEPTLEDRDAATSSDDQYQPCPGESVGKTEPGREPEGGGYPPVTTE